MIKLCIKKFEQGNKKPLTTVSIPLAVIKMVKSLIPKKAKEELQKEGIDIKEIIKLSESPDFTGTVLEVDNHEKNEKVIISLEKQIPIILQTKNPTNVGLDIVDNFILSKPPKKYQNIKVLILF